jgi:hypothetical protein
MPQIWARKNNEAILISVINMEKCLNYFILNGLDSIIGTPAIIGNVRK